MAEPGLPDDADIMLDHPLLASGLQRALRSGRPALLAGTAARSLYDLTVGLSALFVAVDTTGAVVGVLMALPPVRVLGQFLQAGVPVHQVLFAAHTVIKLKGVAVDESARGRGIGTALITLCVQLYTDLGWRAVYGQFDKKNTQLEDYYTRLGFTVLSPRKAVDFSHLVPFPLATHPLGGERLFVHWTDADHQVGTQERATW
jgi:GNAT superfamily N-acetyltransferase